MIDATYKTIKYDLPLFFITVGTNIGYCVVAEFIIWSEDKLHLRMHFLSRLGIHSGSQIIC